MLRASLKNLLSRKIRLVMSSIAIVLGVGFVVGSLIFGDMLKATFDNIMRGSVGDVVVALPAQQGGGGAPVGVNRTIPTATVKKMSQVDGAARADGWVTDSSTFVVDKDGKLVGGNGAPGLAFNYSDVPSVTQDHVVALVEGRAPTKKGEVALDEGTAKKAGYEIGDEVTFVTSGATPRLTSTLVGTVEFGGGGLAGASLTFFDTASAQEYYLGGRDAYTEVWVTTEDGVSQDDLAKEVAPLAPKGFETKTGQKAGDDAAASIGDALKFVNYFLLVFAGISLFVGAFLIVNTFNILVGQRVKELALFRAMGASRGQVTRSVLLEALIVGLIGSAIGVLVGILLAMLISALFAAFGLDLSGTGLVIKPRTIITAFLIGVPVTMLAAYLPARKAGRVAPVQAMGDEPAMPKESAIRTLVIGSVLTALGVVGMVLGLFTDISNPVIYLGLGILLVMLGVAVVSPVFGRPFIVAIGGLYRAVFGQVGTMAERNSVRNPGRTAATASALMIGVTLVTMMSVFGASAKKSIEATISEGFTGDYVVSNAIGQPFSPEITEEVAKVDGIAAASPLRFAPVQLAGGQTMVVGVDPKTYPAFDDVTVEGGSLSELGPGEVLLDKPQSAGHKVGDELTVAVGGSESTVRVAGFFEPEGLLQDTKALMSLDGLDALSIRPQDALVYVQREPGADPAATKADLDAIVKDLPTVTIKSKSEFVDEQSKQIDQLLYMIYALLGLALVIAILGVVNTLGLSTIERTREIGLLRAVGLSRRQLAGMITLESVVISLLGAVLGVGLGVVFGVALQRALRDDGIGQLAIPWAPIVVVLVASVIVGLIAAIVPAIRAARMDVLKAIQTV